MAGSLRTLERLRQQGAAPINEEELRSVDLKLRQWRVPSSSGGDEEGAKKRLKTSRR